MRDDPPRRRSQREIREGKAPRRLAERAVGAPRHRQRARGAGAYISVDVHNAPDSEVIWLSPSWRF